MVVLKLKETSFLGRTSLWLCVCRQIGLNLTDNGGIAPSVACVRVSEHRVTTLATESLSLRTREGTFSDGCDFEIVARILARCLFVSQKHLGGWIFWPSVKPRNFKIQSLDREGDRCRFKLGMVSEEQKDSGGSGSLKINYFQIFVISHFPLLHWEKSRFGVSLFSFFKCQVSKIYMDL